MADGSRTPGQIRGSAKAKLNAKMRTMSALLERTQFASQVGLMFDGNRDLYTIYGYKRTLGFADYLNKYKRQDVARRIVDQPPASTWFGDIRLETKDGGPIDEFTEFAEETQFFPALARADRLCGFGQYAILLIGLDDGRALDQPVRKGKHKVIYLQPYSQASAVISEYEDNPKDARYALPRMYNITVQDPTMLSTTRVFGTTLQPSRRSPARGINVHWSRVIHIADNPLENNVFGQPRLESCFNLLEDLMKIAGGSAELFWLNSNRGMHADLDKEMDLDPDEEDALSDEIEEYQHTLRRFIRTRGVKIEKLGADPVDPRGTFEVTMSLISSDCGIPKRILLGSEAGQLASEQDRANWATVIGERRHMFAEPLVLRPAVKQLMDIGVLTQIPQGYKVNWPSAFIMSPLELAQMYAQHARSAVNFSRQGEKGAPLTSVEEGRRMIGLPEKVPTGHTPWPIHPIPSEETVNAAGTTAEANKEAQEEAPEPGDPKSSTSTGPAKGSSKGPSTADRHPDDHQDVL
jgi:hypothetical protein